LGKRVDFGLSILDMYIDYKDHSPATPAELPNRLGESVRRWWHIAVPYSADRRVETKPMMDDGLGDLGQPLLEFHPAAEHSGTLVPT